MTSRPTWDVPGAKVRAAATVSPCGQYRYDLEREYDPHGDWALFIGLNPSTADGRRDDPTITREIDFAHGFGFPNLAKLNLYAVRSTDPRGVRAAMDPVGPDSAATLRRWLRRADLVLLAWGYSAKVGKRMLARAWEVRRDIRDEFRAMAAAGLVTPPVGCLGFTEGKERQPRHPLMLRADTPWTALAP